MHIVEGGLDDPRVIQLLHTHRTRARAETAPGSAYALDPSGLRAPDLTFWSAWEGDAVVGTHLGRYQPCGGLVLRQNRCGR